MLEISKAREAYQVHLVDEQDYDKLLPYIKHNQLAPRVQVKIVESDNLPCIKAMFKAHELHYEALEAIFNKGNLVLISMLLDNIETLYPALEKAIINTHNDELFELLAKNILLSKEGEKHLLKQGSVNQILIYEKYNRFSQSTFPLFFHRQDIQEEVKNAYIKDNLNFLSDNVRQMIIRCGTDEQITMVCSGSLQEKAFKSFLLLKEKKPALYTQCLTSITTELSVLTTLCQFELEKVIALLNSTEQEVRNHWLENIVPILYEKVPKDDTSRVFLINEVIKALKNEELRWLLPNENLCPEGEIALVQRDEIELFKLYASHHVLSFEVIQHLIRQNKLAWFVTAVKCKAYTVTNDLSLLIASDIAFYEAYVKLNVLSSSLLGELITKCDVKYLRIYMRYHELSTLVQLTLITKGSDEHLKVFLEYQKQSIANPNSEKPVHILNQTLRSLLVDKRKEEIVHLYQETGIKLGDEETFIINFKYGPYE